jgi:hypothetical protein
MDPLNVPAIHGEQVAGQEASIRRDLLRLTTDINVHTFDVAELLFHVHESRLYLKWNFEKFADYAEQELGLKVRKAEYLSRIVRVMNTCGIKRSDYEPAGVTKLRQITTLNPEENFFNAIEKTHTPMVELITNLVAEAPELSALEVEVEVARLKGQTGENAMVLRNYKVTLSAWENVITRCYESVRMKLGSAGRDGTGAAIDYSDGKVIETLCAEWNADPRNFLEETDESHAQIEIPTEDKI